MKGLIGHVQHGRHGPPSVTSGDKVPQTGILKSGGEASSCLKSKNVAGGRSLRALMSKQGALLLSQNTR
jgi:hypothetical protein